MPTANLPLPSPEALAHSHALCQHIAADITAQGGWISFARYMELALYAPGLGYYTAGARKFGAAGDFITAPEISPFFAAAIARQITPWLAASAPQIIEVGAGSGRLAADLLLALEQENALPERYQILDLSPDLRARQFDTLAARAPHLLARVEWLDALPTHFSGVVLGNEVLDAMPVHLVVWQGTANAPEPILERGVSVGQDGNFIYADRPASGAVLAAATEIATEAQSADAALIPGYVSEICLAARGWAAAWGEILQQGAVLLFDYGFPRHEFYHPQRHMGTLMCHYRHHSHPDPFYLPGLQDLTAHVDFTSIIAAAFPQGLELLGYTNQATFLLNAGLLTSLSQLQPGTPAYIQATTAVNKLTSPAEMGELFKVIALGKNVTPGIGFLRGDRSYTL